MCGNTVAVAGDASAECDGKQSTNKKSASSASNGRGGNRRILSANQGAALNSSSSVKVGVCGIAVAVAGNASGNCEGNQSSASATSLSSNGSDNGSRAVLSDNQASALNGSPTGQVGVCGIALAVAGDASASCEGNQGSSLGSDASLASTGGPNRSIGSGNQTAAGNGSPTGQVAVCGIAVGVAGDSSANCEGNQSSANADGTSLSNSDEHGIGSGNQVAALTGSPTAQAGVCGVAVGIAGDTSASCDGNRDSEANSSVSSIGSGDAERGIGSGRSQH